MTTSLLLGCLGNGGQIPATTPSVQASSPVAAGRYLVLIGGCNDCHTEGWQASNGRLAEGRWLTGSGVGLRGPWGTSYAKNLRLSAAHYGEQDWIALFRVGAGLPPMPWMNYRTMSDEDLVAIHRFLRDLGPEGAPAPAPVPPDREPGTPYILFTPQQPRGAAPSPR